ncbi:Trm112 family protein [Cutibacterium sp.]|uniref:Trm112 family protein n=1 Tax=Cutibacterium sp. TaxID=1912221 RepID=UPI0026DA9A63|nr:Trm112 family protein [Cutibacterium sp.]MDO4413343.1 Trm112 family protein [Cutibacterium sp.]
MPDLPLVPEALDLSPAFLEVAACPACHSRFALDFDSGELVCSSPSCGLAFAVRDGVPDLRLDAARERRVGSQHTGSQGTEAFESTRRHETRPQ